LWYTVVCGTALPFSLGGRACRVVAVGVNPNLSSMAFVNVGMFIILQHLFYDSLNLFFGYNIWAVSHLASVDTHKPAHTGEKCFLP
jgi:hypothetical protein